MDEQRREAVERLPLYRQGSFVGALHRPSGQHAVLVGVGGGAAVQVWFALQDPAVAVAVLSGIAMSWPLRRAYQWLPTAQQMTVLVDPEGLVKVAMGRGAVRPAARRISKGPDSDALGFLAGAVACLVGLALFVALPFATDALIGTPVPVLALPAAGVWLLVELVLRIVQTNRRLANGWRLGTDALAGDIVLWHHENGLSWRRGVPAEELLAVVARHRQLATTAATVVRPLMNVEHP